MKTQLSKPARGRASYPDEYKQQALELWRASGRGAAKVAVELDSPTVALPLGMHGTCAQGQLPAQANFVWRQMSG